MMKMTRGNYVLVLLAVIGICATGLAWRNRMLPRTSAPAIEPVARPAGEIQADWRAGITRILTEYDRTQDAKAAEDGLLGLRVTEGDRDVHLELAIAFQALVDSRVGGKGLLQAARAHFEGRETMLR